MRWILILFLLTTVPLSTHSQSLNPKKIMQKVREKLTGNTNQGSIRMTIVRPKWTRTMEMKTWSLGDDLALILVTAPARDKGTAFLKRNKEIWNWLPRIDRTIKLPPSMMMQSWMGSDFTNDDLVRESSVVDDYDQKLLGEDTIDGHLCYQIELIPHEDAAVVWGKIITWIDKEEFIELKTEFYDEDDYLTSIMYGKNIKKLGGKKLASVLEMIPSDKDGHKTIVEQVSLSFDKPIPESFFSIQNMKRVR